MNMTGAQSMVRCLEEEDVSHIFGYPGATICPFYEALYHSESIQHILVRQEQSAAHMASGYARITGKAGVCVVTSGPGATNLITGIATAYMDSIPLVAITGQVQSYLLGRDIFQEVDITGAVSPFIKHTYLIKKAEDIPRIFKEAFHIATTGRPGPVLIDVPIDMQEAEIDFSYPEEVNIRGYKPTINGNLKQLKKVVKTIAAAERPLICVGGGAFCAKAQEQVRQLCEETKIPMVTTMMGLGVLPTSHPLNIGMIGSFGHKTANMALSQTDLLILVGARVGDRAITAPEKISSQSKTIHIDIDPAEIGKNVNPTVPLVGDLRAVLESLLADIRAMLAAREDVYKDTIRVQLTGFGSSSIDILIQFYTTTGALAEFLKIQEFINLELMDIVYKNGCSFAFPSTSVYIEKAPASAPRS